MNLKTKTSKNTKRKDLNKNKFNLINSIINEYININQEITIKSILKEIQTNYKDSGVKENHIKFCLNQMKINYKPKGVKQFEYDSNLSENDIFYLVLNKLKKINLEISTNNMLNILKKDFSNYTLKRSYVCFKLKKLKYIINKPKEIKPKEKIELSNEEYFEYKNIIGRAVMDYKNKYNIPNKQILFDEADIILISCLKNFDKSKETKFTTYLYNSLILGFHNAISKHNKINFKKHRQGQSYFEDLNLIDVLDYYTNDNDSFDNYINNTDQIKITNAIKEIIENDLPKSYKTIINDNLEKNNFNNTNKIIAEEIKRILLVKYNLDIEDLEY